MNIPLHPLAVHLPVVLVPLSVLFLLASVATARWRNVSTTLGTVFAWVSFAGLLVAKETGESLAHVRGVPSAHEMWADFTVVAVGLLAVFATAWALPLLRELGKPGLTKLADAGAKLAPIARVLVALAAIASLVFIVLVGHSGASAVWDKPAASATAAPASAAPAQAAPAASAPSGATSAPASAADGSFTMAEIAKHNSAESCWVAINGTAYDLTTWINHHPGGPAVIGTMCGTDGTAAFTVQHGGEGEPAAELAQFKLGPVK
ncbi:putative membrane protein [Arcanobacterium wilhelmae]|uniref:Membrane protein n=1 Tax=Arcanobacterium wilhelmae TaxID=1803177 RepID=A0ABT9NCS7_9ACTO|nr:cytochrome b5-like heme/steroid binding domain-containing protein [Arcanobacterium wilhelmae]MDP9801181.1 putative membrane protein [Arcanobacterium wilhelmae]WFN90533.1 cytochrome b5-like heme/steroid binding domain-containing protein [Arcanobacterium wilhelmae]